MKIRQIRAVDVALPRVEPKTAARRPSWNTYAPRVMPMNKYQEFPPLPGKSPGIGTPVGGGAVWVQVVAE